MNMPLMKMSSQRLEGRAMTWGKLKMRKGERMMVLVRLLMKKKGWVGDFLLQIMFQITWMKAETVRSKMAVMFICSLTQSALVTEVTSTKNGQASLPVSLSCHFYGVLALPAKAGFAVMPGGVLISKH